ncbi:DUF2141 domain-containing protein [Xylanibacter oryzae]|uniref:DUF2141 domain-containing protein n=1 Tax=Xylanibacter oryzae TaxID=185293 RepID=UPI00055A11B6|nr:DUF2141 domain-containing protein [Xylanibacter oryzae]
MKKIMLSATLLMLFSCATFAQNLEITISGIRNSKGKILLMIESDNLKTPNKYMSEITGKSCNFVLNNIQEGTYKISAFHDENGNYEIDKDEKGIPTEGFILKTIKINKTDLVSKKDTKIDTKLFYPKTAE